MDRNLAAFLATAKHHTLTDAAENLGLTQPTLTKRISSLETQLGARLFDRGRHGTKLTEIGRVYLRRALRIEAEYRQCQEEVDSFSEAGLSTMRVGSGPLFQMTCVANLFAMLRKGFPNLKLELITQTSNVSGIQLREGGLDLYLGIIPPEQIDDTIYFLELTSVEHGLVLRSDDQIASGPKIDPSDLCHYTWVSFSDDPVTENALLRHMAPDGSNDSLIDIRSNSFAIGLQLVRSGQFVMSAPLQLSKVIQKESLVVRPSITGMPKRKAGLYVRRSAMNFGAMEAVLKYFDELDSEIFEN